MSDVTTEYDTCDLDWQLGDMRPCHCQQDHVNHNDRAAFIVGSIGAPVEVKP